MAKLSLSRCLLGTSTHAGDTIEVVGGLSGDATLDCMSGGPFLKPSQVYVRVSLEKGMDV